MNASSQQLRRPEPEAGELDAVEATHKERIIDEDSPSEEIKTLPLDQKFELLKNQRRRRVLRYLMENGETGTTGDLAEHVAALENGKDISSLTSKERKATYVGLYQCHLPKMDDYGVIKFNQARGTIELKPLAYQLEEYLKETPPARWSLRYLTLSSVSSGLILLSFLAESWMLSSLIVIGSIAAIATLALTHWRDEQGA